MKSAAFSFLLLAALTCGVLAQQDVPDFIAPPPRDSDKIENISKEVALKAIALLQREPASDRGRSAAALILKYADASPDVEVTIDPALMPWINQDPPPRYLDVLLGAYIAGNVRPQIETGVKKDNPLSGITQVIDTYRQLKKADISLFILSIENYAKLQSQGKLKSTIESITAKAAKKEATPQ